MPGDLISDLQRAGLVGDPLFEDNFLNGSRTWHLPHWDYTKRFQLEDALLQSGAAAGARTVLVLDGVKMGAEISLNGHRLGVATDQFLRYQFPLPAAALAEAAGGQHELRVSFNSSINCGGRVSWRCFLDLSCFPSG